MSAALDFTDAVVVITGAGSGLGRAGATRFAGAGARVVVADIDRAAAQETVQLVVAAGGEAVAVAADVSRPEDCAALMAAAADSFGAPDVVWANAGIPHAQQPLVDVPVEDFDRVMAVNARGAWLTARAAARAIGPAGGSILLTASMAALRGRPNNSVYAASKGAVVAMAQALAVELAPARIRVNAISPVAADTPMLPSFLAHNPDPAAATTSMADAIPLGRLCRPDDVADAALYLASPLAAMISGSNLRVDGGYGA